MPRKKRASREMLGLSRGEFAVLRRLRTPEKIQAFLYGLRQNFELTGETCNSVRTAFQFFMRTAAWPGASQYR